MSPCPSRRTARRELQIASDLNISEWTVSTHLRRIYSKLGIRTRAALAYRCAFLLTGSEDGDTPERRP
ncbi:response regulator transcription factor [Paraburkholderia sp.]|uniref:response regulator transcription factor n=1 Tax=Paraburkholderia sp. TaxID=1926495 RepID=UPI0039C9F40A